MIPLHDWLICVVNWLGVLFAMVSITLFLLAAVWFSLKALDAIEAWIYNRIRKPCTCPGCAPQLWAERPAPYLTKDQPRPRRYWGGKSVAEICAELERSA